MGILQRLPHIANFGGKGFKVQACFWDFVWKVFDSHTGFKFIGFRTVIYGVSRKTSIRVSDFWLVDRS